MSRSLHDLSLALPHSSARQEQHQQKVTFQIHNADDTTVHSSGQLLSSICSCINLSKENVRLQRCLPLPDLQFLLVQVICTTTAVIALTRYCAKHEKMSILDKMVSIWLDKNASEVAAQIAVGPVATQPLSSNLTSKQPAVPTDPKTVSHTLPSPLSVTTIIERIGQEISGIKDIFDEHADQYQKISWKTLCSVLWKLDLADFSSRQISQLASELTLDIKNPLSFSTFLQVYAIATKLNRQNTESTGLWFRMSTGYWTSLSSVKTRRLRETFDEHRITLTRDSTCPVEVILSSYCIDAFASLGLFGIDSELQVYLHTQGGILKGGLNFYEYGKCYMHLVERLQSNGDASVVAPTTRPTIGKQATTRRSVEDLLRQDVEHEVGIQQPSSLDRKISISSNVSDNCSDGDSDGTSKSDRKPQNTSSKDESKKKKYKNELKESKNNNSERAITKAFQMYDLNNDGNISFSELRTVFTTRGWHVPDAELQQWIHDRDTSNTGLVNYTDFKRTFTTTVPTIAEPKTSNKSERKTASTMRLTTPLHFGNDAPVRQHPMKKQPEKNNTGQRLGGITSKSSSSLEASRGIRRAFEEYDYNGDGEISFLDLKKVFAQNGKNLSDMEIQNWITKRDTRGLGTVNLPDFIEAYTSLNN